jgi:hypothetical protein
MDVHTHFLRDDTRLEGFVRGREAVGKAGWNPDLVGKPQTLDDLKYPNWFKEIYLDSDTKVALISGSPSEEPRDWFLTNDMKLDARTKVNNAAGSRRCLSHAIFTPAIRAGWTRSTAPSRRSSPIRGRATRRRQHQQEPGDPSWRMDDEKLVYPFYEKLLKAGYDIVCVHKGLYPPSVAERFPISRPMPASTMSARPPRTGPNIRFVIYHSAFRWTGAPGASKAGYEQFEKTGRVEWTSDLADIPAKYGVSNVYGDLGQIFAQTVVAEPRLAAAVMGMLVKGLGADHVVWGTDALWTGAPQWQIEGLRRLEIPRRCAASSATPNSVPPTARSSGRSSARIRPGCIATTSRRRPGATTASPRSIGVRAHRPRSVEPALRFYQAYSRCVANRAETGCNV